ncbi:ABC transporter substrate-binding protein [Trichloromonas sp.]|uniref:ABC transporter substrate-binding protein n=1 Tax=Trichloromonas sp. TaxID=3069249 RepID=UPI003D817AB2
MISRKLIAGLTLLLALAFAISGHAGSGEPVRIVSLSPGLTEILYAIGAQGRLAGVSRQCDYPLAARLKPRCGDFNHPDMARIAKAGAGLVLLSEQVRDADLELLAEAGLQARVFPASSGDDIIRSILAIGELTDKVERARELAAELQAEMDRIGARLGHLAETQRPRVYLEVDGPQLLYSVGRDSFMSDLIRRAGGSNVFADRPLPYLAVSTQEVVQADPQIILLDHPFQYKVGAAKREGWDGISAVRSRRIYDATDFDMILINRPGPRLPQALNELARMFHPEVFDVQKTD